MCYNPNMTQFETHIINICYVRSKYNRPCYDCVFVERCKTALEKLNKRYKSEADRPSFYINLSRQEE